MKIIVHLAVILSFLMLLGACNIFDALYPDDGSSNFDRALANAEAAMKRDDYKGAYDLYKKALEMRPNSSAARIGIASAIIMDRVYISDIPHLMNSVFNIDIAGENEEYADLLGKLKGPGELGITVEEYIDIITEALGEAAYWRAPVNSIDPVTGIMATDSSGMPAIDPEKSDGVIEATNCNSILNYIICKTMEAAFKARKNFVIAKNLAASVDASFINDYPIPTEDEVKNDILSGTFNEDQYKETFTNFYTIFTNTYTELAHAYTNLKASFTDNSTNTSLENLAGTAKGLQHILENTKGMNENITETVSNAVFRIDYGLGKLKDSFDESDGLIANALVDLEAFETDLKNFGEKEIRDTDLGFPDMGEVFKHSWFPY